MVLCHDTLTSLTSLRNCFTISKRAILRPAIRFDRHSIDCSTNPVSYAQRMLRVAGCILAENYIRRKVERQRSFRDFI